MSIDQALSALKSPDRHKRRQAVLALGQSRDTRVLHALVHGVRHEGDRSLQELILRTLLRLHPGLAQDEEIRRLAAQLTGAPSLQAIKAFRERGEAAPDTTAEVRTVSRPSGRATLLSGVLSLLLLLLVAVLIVLSLLRKG